jgi:hypothetical protein
MVAPLARCQTARSYGSYSVLISKLRQRRADEAGDVHLRESDLLTDRDLVQVAVEAKSKNPPFTGAQAV